MTTFGDLRSAVHRQPSRENFEHLITLIENAEVPEEVVREQWVPYLDSALSSWPRDTRATTPERVLVLERHDTTWSSLVRTLDYSGDEVTEDRVDAFTQATHLSRVTRLDLSRGDVTWPILEALVTRAPFDTLESLSLCLNSRLGIDGKTLLRMWRSPMLSRLEELSLARWNRLNSTWLKATMDTLPLDDIKALDLSGTGALKHVLEDVLGREELSNVRTLRLHDTTLPMPALEAAEHLTELEVLDIGGGSNSLASFHSIPEHVRGLRCAHFDGSIPGEDALTTFLSPTSYPDLTVLDLSYNALGNRGLRAFVHTARFPALERLALRKCGLTELDALTYEDAPKTLRALDLTGNTIRQGRWSQLRHAPFYDGLTHLATSGRSWQGGENHDHEVFEAPLPPTLTWLRVRIRNSSDVMSCAKALEHTRGLRTLIIPGPYHSPWDNRPAPSLSEEAMDTLMHSNVFDDLRELSLAHHNATASQIERLLDARPTLEALTLGYSTDSQLQTLHNTTLGGCRISLYGFLDEMRLVS